MSGSTPVGGGASFRSVTASSNSNLGEGAFPSTLMARSYQKVSGEIINNKCLSQEDPMLPWSALDPSQYQALSSAAQSQPQYEIINDSSKLSDRQLSETIKNLDLGSNIKVNIKKAIPRVEQSQCIAGQEKVKVKEPSLSDLAATKPSKQKAIKKQSSSSDLGKLLASVGMLGGSKTSVSKKIAGISGVVSAKSTGGNVQRSNGEVSEVSSLLKSLQADLKKTANSSALASSTISHIELQERAMIEKAYVAPMPPPPAAPPGFVAPPPGFRLIPGLPPPQFIGHVITDSEEVNLLKSSDWVKVPGTSETRAIPPVSTVSLVSDHEFPSLPLNASTSINLKEADDAWLNVKTSKNEPNKTINVIGTKDSNSNINKKKGSGQGGGGAAVGKPAGVSVPKKVRDDLLSMAFKK